MPSITALLGPTNTGKTYHAMERMLAHRTGMIGFPLRLLARENYDRLVRSRGADDVALVTGEERIVPRDPSYYVCTVEAMPLDRRVDFLAVDEIQLCADRERGHVFTDRLLHARGLEETMFLGAETIKPLLRALVPKAAVIGRPRLSTLSYAAPRKIARLPRRTALVVFSVADLYVLADRVRRETGGAALVFGALSPRTRNAQVALYQAGEVDYLVATDAIGMGLNLDIDHVAFTGLVKYDGTSPRHLRAAEVAQIAGPRRPLPARRHLRADRRARALRRRAGGRGRRPSLRAARLPLLAQFRGSTSRPPARCWPAWSGGRPSPQLRRAREADDHRALAVLAADPAVAADTTAPEAVRLLWDVCQVPDFRNVLTDAHTRLLGQMYRHLRHGGRLPEDWVAAQVAALDRVEGDTDALLSRIAHIRTWTYVSHRPAWLADAPQWQQRTRAVEDRLSDALHERLTEQFVDRRAAVVARSGDGRAGHRGDGGGRRARAGPSRGAHGGVRLPGGAGPARTRPAASAAPPTARCGGTSATACARSPRSRTTRSRPPPTGASAGGARRWRACSPPTTRWSRGWSRCRPSSSTRRSRRRCASGWRPGSRASARGSSAPCSRRSPAARGAVRGIVFAIRQGLGSAPRRALGRALDALDARRAARAGPARRHRRTAERLFLRPALPRGAGVARAAVRPARRRGRGRRGWARRRSPSSRA